MVDVWPTVALGTISVLCILMAGVTWERRQASALAIPLFVLFLAIALWNGSYALHLAGAPTPESTPEIWFLLSYIGTVTIPAGVLVLAVRLTGRDSWPGPGIIAALAVEPLLVLAAVTSPYRYDLIFDGVRDPTLLPTASGGAVFWINLAYSFALVAIAAALIAHRVRTTNGIMQRQAITVLVAILVPWAVTAVVVLLLPAEELDLTPPSMGVSVLVMGFAFFRYRLLELGPVARHAMFDVMADAAVALDDANCITDLNPAAAAMFGVERSAVLGRPLIEAIADERDLLQLLSRRDEGPGEASLTALPDHVVEARVTALTDRSGWPIGRLVVCRDITDRKELERQLATLASRDPLTGVGNRRALEADWARERSRADRRGEPLACVLLDLDNFKQLNDTAGHAAGDNALVAFAHTLRKELRRIDTIARIGGDEFVVLMPATTADAAAQVTVRVVAEVGTQLSAEFGAGHLSVSAGVTVSESESLADALARADEALYRAKQSGPGTIRVAGAPCGDSG